MNLFIETPQRASERLAREGRARDAWLEAVQQQYAAQQVQAGTNGRARDAAASAAADASATDAIATWADARHGDTAAFSEAAGDQASATCHRRDDRMPHPSDDGYSVAQSAYHDELAFQKRRARRRRLATLLRTLALIVLIPVLLVAVFIGSYVFTCILNGATPQEVGELLRNMVSRVEGFILSLSS